MKITEKSVELPTSRAPERETRERRFYCQTGDEKWTTFRKSKKSAVIHGNDQPRKITPWRKKHNSPKQIQYCGEFSCWSPNQSTALLTWPWHELICFNMKVNLCITKNNLNITNPNILYVKNNSTLCRITWFIPDKIDVSATLFTQGAFSTNIFWLLLLVCSFNVLFHRASSSSWWCRLGARF